MVDEHAGVAMTGFVSDGLGLSLLLRNLFLMRKITRNLLYDLSFVNCMVVSPR